MPNPFWEYSLAQYALDGVAPLCLALQDEHGVDVNLLLYAGWLASLNRRLTPGHLETVAQATAPWREGVILPLRALRRQLAKLPAARAISRQLAELELEAERQQQDMLHGLFRNSAALPLVEGELPENLALVAQLAAGEASGWRGPVKRLAALLSG